MGGATVYWFTGAPLQPDTGPTAPWSTSRRHQDRLTEAASIEKSKNGQDLHQVRAGGHAQHLIVIFCLTLRYAFFDPIFFVAVPGCRSR